MKNRNRGLTLALTITLCAAAAATAQELAINADRNIVRPGGTVALTGRALDPTFQDFTVEWAPGAYVDAGWSTEGVTLAEGGAEPVELGLLATWQTPLDPFSGYFTVRLTVRSAFGVSEARTLVYLEPDLIADDRPLVVSESPRGGLLPWGDIGGAPLLATLSAPPAPDPYSSPTTTLWLVPSSGPPTQRFPMSTPAPMGGRFAVGDVDGLPGEELVIPTSEGVTVLVNPNGPSPATLPSEPDVDFSQSVVTLADLDGDGRLEILAMGRGQGPAEGQTLLYAWTGDGRLFAPAFPIVLSDASPASWTSARSQLVVADLDSDGRKEIVAVQAVGGSTSAVRRFTSDGVPVPTSIPELVGTAAGLAAVAFGSFAEPTLVLALQTPEGTDVHCFDAGATPRPGWPRSLPVGKAYGIQVADLDRDGRPELILPIRNALSVLKADGGDFEPFSPLPIPGLLGPAVVADIDGDSWPEIIIVTDGTGGSGGVAPEISLRAVSRDGRIAREWTLPGLVREGVPTALAQALEGGTVVGDFDSNGETDLAVVYGSAPAPPTDEPTLGILTMLATHAPYSATEWPVALGNPRNNPVRLWAPIDHPPGTSLLVVEKRGIGSGHFDSPEWYVPDADCRVGCAGAFPTSSHVLLVPRPAPGSVFQGWAGACSGLYTCEITLGEDAVVIASFGLQPVIGPEQRAALEALFSATGGPGWYRRDNWLGPIGSEATWYGITVDPASHNVTKIELPHNQLRGGLPVELRALVSLQALDLSENQLTGTLPSGLSGLAALRVLNLSGNQLAGGIPAWLTGLSQLQELSLKGNPLGGTIPSNLGRLTQLRVLNLSSCRLSGTIPTSITSIPRLSELWLGWNNLQGGIPSGLTALTGLERLDLRLNRLSGTIPAQIGNLRRLLWLVLSDNQLTGGIPAGISGLAAVTWLDLDGNRLTGPVPDGLASLRTLLSLDLSDNLLTGEISRVLSLLLGLPTLSDVSLRGNRFTGSIPSTVGDFVSPNFVSLDLGRNQLTGPIPHEIGRLSRLRHFFADGNQLAGEVPREIMNLRQLRGWLRLHWNALHTDDPELLAFLEGQSWNQGWQATQTVAPTMLRAELLMPGSVGLSWQPIGYQSGTGGYKIYSGPVGTPLALWGATSSKAVSSVTVTGLDSSTSYAFAVESFTAPHSDNPNQVVSERSAIVVAQR